MRLAGETREGAMDLSGERRWEICQSGFWVDTRLELEGVPALILPLRVAIPLSLGVRLADRWGREWAGRILFRDVAGEVYELPRPLQELETLNGAIEEALSELNQWAALWWPSR